MDKIWWNQITKAHKFIEDIAAAAAGGTSTVLFLPENVPWKNTLLELTGDRLKMENPRNSFVVTECPQEDAGLFLLNRFCAERKRATYRYGMSYAAFLGRCEDIVLNNRYIWVADVSDEKYDEWLDFVTEYNKSTAGRKTHAVFILETHSRNLARKLRKGIRVLSFDQNIGMYDRFTFCALIAAENSCKDYLRPYLAELASAVCGEDAELCAQCVQAGKGFMEHPGETLGLIAQNEYRSDGSAYCFSKSDDEIRRQVWETQLKNIFPVIEKYRNHFIEKNREDIKKALPISNSFGEMVEKPEDVEIGTLFYLAGLREISLSVGDYEELKLYRNARNMLAHLNVLDFEDVDAILSRANTL